MRRGPEFTRGQGIAAFLAGSWRTVPPAVSLPATDLVAVLDLLLDGGAGALAWWRLRPSALRRTRAGRQFHGAYIGFTAEATESEQHIAAVVAVLRGAGVEPLLIKGWASARHYAEPGLRPYGDIDLCVSPTDLAAAMRVLAGPSVPAGVVDLHGGVPDLSDRVWSDAIARSRLVPLGATQVRILGAEDHLRLLCLHLVRHGAHRPLWLCDVGAALESLPADFDWTYCLSGRCQLSAWVGCIVALACSLLGARPNVPPPGSCLAHPPVWVVRTVLWRWGAGRAPRSPRYYFRHPWTAFQGLPYLALNPIKAAFDLHLSPLHWLPLPLLQLAAFFGRKLPMQLRRQLGKLRGTPPRPFAVHEGIGF